MARIIRRHGGGRILRRSREEKRRLSEGGGGASQQPQGPAEDDYCPVIGSKINMDGISDQEVANAYSFVFSFDEALRSIKLEEGRLLIHIADLYEMKRSLDDKITSLKAAESPRSWRISIDEVAVVADSDGDTDVNAEQLLHLLEHVGAIGENTYGSNASATTTGRSVHSLLGMVPHHDREVEATGVAAAVVPALSSSPFPRLRAARDGFGTHGGRRQFRPCQKYKSGRIASRRRRGAEREQLPLENTSKDTHMLAAPAAAPDGTRPPTDMTQNSKSSAVSFVTKPLAAASARGSGTTPAMT
uniref:Uncharacterized protein n=1 Tax=Oryza rufipogon TaxID=4529 RepID=A0A0E0N609_ORYRU